MEDERKPIPEPRKRGATRELRRLNAIGASVWLPLRMSAIGQAANYAGLTGKYAARTEGDGVRVWRIKL